MSSEAAKYLRYARQCTKAAERTTNPKVREKLLKVVADLMAAALYAASSGTTPPKPRRPSRAACAGLSIDMEEPYGSEVVIDIIRTFRLDEPQSLHEPQKPQDT